VTALFNAGMAAGLAGAHRRPRPDAGRGVWISGGFHLGLVTAPRATRFVASVLTALTISDFLQIAYKAAEERGLGGS
jgi:Protein of unknown function (DUF1360)